MRRVGQLLLLAFTGASAVAALATAAVWIRSVWVAESVGWETLEATSRGGQRHANTAIHAFPGALLLFRQLNDGPATFTSPIDPKWQWYKEPVPTVTLRDLWFWFSFTHYSLPPRPGEMIGDRGYTLEFGVPDWAIIVVFLALPAWRLWRSRRSQHRQRQGFEPIRASRNEHSEAGGTD